MITIGLAEIRVHLKLRQSFVAPAVREHLSTLGDMLKSWDAGGNRMHLAGNIERTIRAIEILRQPTACPPVIPSAIHDSHGDTEKASQAKG